MYLYRTAASQETEPDEKTEEKKEKKKSQDAFLCSSLCFQLKLKRYYKDNHLLLLHKVEVAFIYAMTAEFPVSWHFVQHLVSV